MICGEQKNYCLFVSQLIPTNASELNLLQKRYKKEEMNEFWDQPLLNGLMLEKDDIAYDGEGKPGMHCCQSCYGLLFRYKVSVYPDSLYVTICLLAMSQTFLKN